MGIAERLKNIAFQPEEGALADPVIAPRQMPARPNPSPGFLGGGPTARTFRTSGAVTGPTRHFDRTVTEDPEMARDIETALAKCTSQGYAELLDQIQALSAVIPDEGARIAAAVASLRVLNLTPEAIRASITDRLRALQDHDSRVKQGLATEVSETEQRFQQSLDTSRKRLADIEAEGSRLRADISDFERELGSIQVKSDAALQALGIAFQRFHDELSNLLQRV